jgi:hypothetical protein
MSRDTLSDAEDFFLNSWETISFDRDFSENEHAQAIYGAQEASDVKHFVVPMKHHNNGEEEIPILRQNLPLSLFSAVYREQLENSNDPPDDRIDNAINKAEENELDVDVEILKKTKQRLLKNGLI